VTFQSLILKLSEFWASRGCALQQPIDVEVGAGTMHPETFLRVLGPAHWSVAYVQPSRRPADGRFGEDADVVEMGGFVGRLPVGSASCVHDAKDELEEEDEEESKPVKAKIAF
jgi:hypothetical protein